MCAEVWDPVTPFVGSPFIDFKISVSVTLFSSLLILFIVLLGTFKIPHYLHIGTDHVPSITSA